MARYVAFLRAINVGGRTVKMDELRRIFESLGFDSVATFIASGNVVFSTSTRSDTRLRGHIESVLRDRLGYEVATILRTCAEVAAIADYPAFPESQMKRARALNVALLADPPGRAAVKNLAQLKTPIDDFRMHGRDLYWLCKKSQSESKINNAVIEKALQARATIRGLNTIRRLSAKYPPAAPRG
jgi:uncharacterized protein (DUF1697 family)